MKPRGLTKSGITAFEQCPKKLWLATHRPDLARFDDGAGARFAAGNRIGEVACGLHPNGVMVKAEPDLSAALAETDRLLAIGHPGPIFEATFQHDGVLVRVDVLERKGSDTWHAAEVKSSTSVKDHHRADLATQIWVMRECGLALTSASVRHVDTSFVLTREGDYAGLFRDEELLEDLVIIAKGRAALVSAAHAMLDGGEPDVVTGDHCSAPSACEFATYCNRDVAAGPEWPVTLLPRGAGRRWVKKGIADLLALSKKDLNRQQAQILAATRTGVPFRDRAGAQKVIGRWGWPRAWIDFESVSPAVPRWIGTRPYERIPFQFSLHLEREDGAMTHHEYLSCDGTDPRRACAEALVAMIPEGACLIAYYAPFERSVLRDLARWFPDLADRLLAMEAATVDLLPVTRDHWYHRDQRGSWSIKKVLPTIAPELDYASLEVKDGGLAQEAWLEAADPSCTPLRREAIADALRAYCERDTWAMVAIARALVAPE